MFHHIVQKPRDVLKGARRFCPVTEEQFQYVKSNLKDVTLYEVHRIMKEAEVIVMHNKKSDLEVLDISEEELGEVKVVDPQQLFHPSLIKKQSPSTPTASP